MTFSWRYLVIMAQILLATIAVAFSFPRRSHFYLRLASCSLVSLLVAAFFPSENFAELYQTILFGTVKYSLFFVLSYVTLLVSFRQDSLGLLVSAILGYTIQHIYYLLFSTIDQFVLDYTALPVENLYSLVYVRRAIFSPALFLLAYYPYHKIQKNPRIVLPGRNVVWILASFVFIDIALGLFFNDVPFSVRNPLFWAVKLLNLVACLLILALLFANVDKENAEQENAVLKEMAKEKDKQYQMSRESIDLINIKCHDLKHQIRNLSSTDPSSLKEVEKAIKIYDSDLKSGNDALDVILQEKSLLCQGKAIQLDCLTEGAALAFLSEADIYSLFGNILDNAIEGVSAIPEGQRVISLKIKSAAGLLFISEKNPYTGVLTFEDGLPKSSKGDDRFHGYGTKSIRYISEKYGGQLQINNEEGIFSLLISIPMPLNAAVAPQ